MSDAVGQVPGTGSDRVPTQVAVLVEKMARDNLGYVDPGIMWSLAAD